MKKSPGIAIEETEFTEKEKSIISDIKSFVAGFNKYTYKDIETLRKK